MGSVYDSFDELYKTINKYRLAEDTVYTSVIYYKKILDECKEDILLTMPNINARSIYPDKFYGLPVRETWVLDNSGIDFIMISKDKIAIKYTDKDEIVIKDNLDCKLGLI